MVNIPSINEIYTSLKNTTEANMKISISVIGRVFLRAYLLAYAAKLKLMYLVLSQIQKNIAPDLCDEDTLLRYGKIKLNRYPRSGVEGQYVVAVTGQNGGTIPLGTVYKSDDNSANPGILYQLDTSYTLIGTSGQITLRCLTAGEEGKLLPGDTLTSTTPLTLVSNNAAVSSEAVQPIAAETIEDYRSAVILAYRLEPKGGSGSDYRLWSLDANGVANVYPYAKSAESGAVNVFVEAKIADSTDGKGTPTQSIMDDVEDVINFSPDASLPLSERGRRPLDVRLYILPITPKNVVITIPSFQGLTTQIQTDITNAITNYIATIRPFVASAEALANKNDILNVNGIIQTISNTEPGSSYGSVSMTVDGSPATVYTFTSGNIPYVFAVNFT